MINIAIDTICPIRCRTCLKRLKNTKEELVESTNVDINDLASFLDRLGLSLSDKIRCPRSSNYTIRGIPAHALGHLSSRTRVNAAIPKGHLVTGHVLISFGQ